MRDFTFWPDESAWREAFIDGERALLADPEEGFDSAAHVELAPQPREVLLWLAHNRPRGATTGEIRAGLGRSDDQEILDSLWVLHRHLELVEPGGQFHVKGTSRWRIIDNRTLFQIAAYPELFTTRQPRRVKIDFEAGGGQQRTELAKHEWGALKRLAACFRGIPDITWSGDSLRR